MRLPDMLRPICLTLGLSVLAAPGTSGTEFSPVQTLAVESSQFLEIAPIKAELVGESVYLLGTNAAGIDTIQRLDAYSLEANASVTLDAAADAMTSAPDGKLIFVVTNNSKNSRILVLDANLKSVGALDLQSRVRHPVLSATQNGYLMVGSLMTDPTQSFFGVFDMTNPAKPKYRSDLRAAEAYRGIAGAWLDLEQSTLFLSASYDARLAALGLGKERILSDFREDAAGKATGAPYAVTAQLGNKACRVGQGTSFVLADMERQTLSLLDYNDSFQSLDPLDFFEFSLAPTRAALRRLEGTNLTEPAGVISSSCDQSVILVGSRTSLEVKQFARNQGLSRLENVGSINLPFRPGDIDVSEDGAYALALNTDGREIVRLSAVMVEGVMVRIIGDSDVRDVQRLLTQAGFDVGAIDGVIGKRTERAANLAEKRFGVTLDVRNDPNGAVEALNKILERRKN